MRRTKTNAKFNSINPNSAVQTEKKIVVSVSTTIHRERTSSQYDNVAR